MDTNLSRAGGCRQSLPQALTSNTATSGTRPAQALSQPKRMGTHAVKQGDGQTPMSPVTGRARKRADFVSLAKAESIARQSALVAAAEKQRAVEIALSDKLRAQQMSGSAPDATNGPSSEPRTPPAPFTPSTPTPARLKARPASTPGPAPVIPPAEGPTTPPSAQIATPATPGPVLMPKLDLAKAFPGQPPGTTLGDPKPALTPAIKRPKLVRSKAKTNGLVQKKPSPRVPAQPENEAQTAEAAKKANRKSKARQSVLVAPKHADISKPANLGNALTMLARLADQIVDLVLEHKTMKLDQPLGFFVLDNLGPQHEVAASQNFSQVVERLMDNLAQDDSFKADFTPMPYQRLQQLFSDKELKILAIELDPAPAATQTRS